MNSGLESLRGAELDHLGIAVRSIEEGLAVWTCLGYRKFAEEVVGTESVRVCFLEGPGVIELLASEDGAGPLARFVASRGTGLHHVAYRVPDLEAAVREVAWTLAGSVRTGALGRPVVFAHPRSTGGVLIEMVEGPLPRRST